MDKQQQMPSSVVTTQPTTVQQRAVIMAQPTNNWRNGLCGCCNDIPSCLCSIFCCCLYYGYIASRMGESCCVGCSGYPVGCVPGGHMAMRSTFRAKHGISGSICGDCSVMYWCLPCGMCQLAREMDSRRQP